MASGSSGRPNSGFDFASDDILCSYDDFSNSQDSANGTHSDPSIGANPSKDFQKSRISRSSVFPSANAYAQPEESLSQEVISTVERTMKKYSDNLMRFLEGISSRLSQLELYCYNLDKSIGEMRSDLVRDHGETDSKLKFLEKHLQEVHRSVQILRDKQELAETQKELAKLQLAQKESSSPSQDERTAVSASEPKKSDDVSDAPNTQLALALPSQIAQQPSHPAAQQPSSQTHSQMQSYYLPPNQLPNPQAQNHPSYLAADAPYRAPQASQPSQSQVNQTPQTQQFPQYQQQWPQQVSQPMQLPQQPPVQPQQPPPMQPPQQPPMPPPQQQPMQAPQQPPMQPPQQPMQPPQQPQNQIRPPTPQSSVYPPYMTNQSANHSPPEGMSSSMSMQMPMPYGYGGASRPVPPQPSPPHMKGGFPSQQGDGYATGGSHQQISSAGSYMLYDGEGGRPHHPSQQPHYSQGSYPPTNPSLPNMPPPGSGGVMIRSPGPQQYVRNHPYNELIDKLVSMGYRGDHVVNVIQRLEESGQAVDFNAVLDRLNGHSSSSSQRSW